MASDPTKSFVHLHTHSHYSLLEALPKIDELVAAAKADGQSALALTDNGNMYAAIEFYKECKKKDIKPILGVEFFVAPRTRHDKEHNVDDQLGRLVLLAKNDAGYKNLLKLVSISYLEGFYTRPRIDRELLGQLNDGLIAILPAHAGELAYALRHAQRDRASQSFAWFKKVYGDRLYQEITAHPEIPGHDKETATLVEFAGQHGVAVVAAHDIYYLDPDDGLACDLVNKIRTGGVLNRDNGEYRMRDFSFVPAKTMKERFEDLPEALDNAARIAELCDVTLDLGKWVFPTISRPHWLHCRLRIACAHLCGLRDSRHAEVAGGHGARRIRARRHLQKRLLPVFPRRLRLAALRQRRGHSHQHPRFAPPVRSSPISPASRPSIRSNTTSPSSASSILSARRRRISTWTSPTTGATK